MTINLLGALATAFIICAVTGPSFGVYYLCRNRAELYFGFA